MSFLRVLRRPEFCCLCRARGFATSSVSYSNAAEKTKKTPAAAAPIVPLSSCTKDTVITGVNYLKGQPPVLALADEEYPEWLWTILQAKVYPEDGPGGKAERVRRRIENKQRIKDRNFMSTQ
ncbi:mitochondrial ribosomal protein L37-domain-containing protein [Lyophyllum atratum]|nr:mitochondrial ribosomal protein L37-domain-containing protein [Lyophyllum atratum]